VAVGAEGAHAEFGGQGQSLTVVVLRIVDMKRIPMRGDLPEKAERPGLVASFLKGKALSRRPA
jgi:hypothetical protein